MAIRDPLLNDFELMEVTAVKITTYFKERLEKLRIENDSYDSHESTRGRIAEIKDFQKALCSSQDNATAIKTNPMI